MAFIILERILKKWRITDNNICELCSENLIEGTDHYFLSCSFNKNLLQNIYEKIGEILETRIIISDVEFITGLWIVSKDKNILILDRFLFLGRMYLIKCRRSKYPISIDNFLEFLVDQFQLEETVKGFHPSKIFRNILWDQILRKITQQ